MWPFDQNNQPMYQQYAQAYETGNYNGFDHHQALGYLQQFMQGAPPDMQQQLFQQHFAQMPYEQRAVLAQQMPPQYSMDPNNPGAMAQSFLRLGQEQPNMLQRVFSHPLLLAGAIGLTGLVAKHMLSHHQNTYGNQQYNNNQASQERYLQQELNQERRQEQELRRELRAEERFEERERHRRDYY
ncbi:MAG TPA: hypothetical protein VFU49_06550 [Ktedonobacteraceae bacterium]|nr:hypothetical protein [Ktedonobacteraceae bacterium]